MVPLIILGILVLVLLYAWSVYNSLVTGRIRIKEALSGIDVQLKRRVDLIPNLVETVKGYAKHEKEVFENVTKARSMLMKAETPQEKAESNNMLTSALKSILGISENYPELKASQNFSDLQSELSDTENKIAYSRQFYNSNVRDFNTTLETFPGNLFGQTFGFKPEQFFETEETSKEPVKVKF